MTDRVLRVLRPIPEHVSEETGLPFWAAFQPSSDDRAHAAIKQQPVRVSVWDARRLTAERAVQLRGVTPALAFALDTAAIRRVVGPPLNVVPDPDGVPDGWPSDARDAHWGIEGLERAPSEPKAEWRARLQRVADLADLVHRAA